jgi:hypothetical protein
MAAETLGRFTCPACLEVVGLAASSAAKKRFCPKCGKEVRWAKPIRRRGNRRLALIGLAMMAVPLALVCVSFVREEATRTVYTDAALSKAVIGKTEDEVRKLLGEPHVTDTEPWNSPQAGKRCVGYALARTKGWGVAGRDGAVGIYFSTKTGRADHIEYIARPQQNNGVLVIRF